MKRSLLLILVTFVYSILYAQNGKISGKVTNSSIEPLAGVSITIEGQTGGVRTDIEGRFSLSANPAKKYNLTFSSVGYAPKTIYDVTVAGNEVQTIDVVLADASKALETVVVQAVRTNARRETTASLLNFQKNNAGVASVLAADFIRRTPDRNTGEVLKRVSGASIQDNKFVIVRGLSDRYNAAFINNAQLPSSEPDKKVFSFDVIPSVLVDNIVISKTATPDITGEFAGGLVQIQTKDVPSKDVFSVGFSIGYNTVSTFKDFTSNERNSTDWIGFDDGTRKLPASFPSNRQRYTVKNDIDKAALSQSFNGDVYKEKSSKAAPNQSYNLTWGKASKLKNGATIGTIVSLIYRNTKAVYSDAERNRYDFERANTDKDYIFKYKEIQNIYTVNWGGVANFTYIQGNHKISFKNLFNRNFEDKYVTRSGTNLNNNSSVLFNSSFLNQRSLYSTQLEGVHQLTTTGIKFTWNLNGATNYKTQPDYRVVDYRRPITLTSNPYVINDDETRRFFSTLQDYSGGFNASLLVPFNLFQQKQTFKIGGSTLVRARNFEARNFQYAGSEASRTLPVDQAFNTSNIGVDRLLINEVTQNTDKYFAVSVLDGMYGMFDTRIGENLRAIFGARLEFFEQFLRSKDLGNENVIVNTEKWDVLPSVNLTYSFNVKNQLRASGALTVARPEFREIAPFAFYDYDAIYGVSGNTDLKRTLIYNADIRYEYYPKAGEAISLGIFYKNFHDPIEFIMNPGSNADRQNYEYRNAKKATSYGAELEIRKNINSDFSVFTNLTYLFSEVTFNNLSAGGKEETASRPLQGQSPYLVNVGLQYNNDKSGLSGSLLYNRVGPRLYLVGSPPPGAGFYDVYDVPRDLVDLQVTKKILKTKGELRLTIADILNQPIGQYDNLTSRESYKAGAGDRFTNRYTPGTTITLAFTYNFLQ
ncbi:MAG: outer membrane beta-barrel protein [Chitinophagaceae bacterium]